MPITQNERIADETRMLEQWFTGRQAMMWTALPGIVQSFDATALTCEVQPAIKWRYVDEKDKVNVVNLPLLLDCPVVFPHAGGCSLTFPIKQGDECLVVFSCRGIDHWWEQGGIQPPPEMRMHDLSDGFVIPGPWSQAKKISNVNTSSVELRSDDRVAYVQINPTSHVVTVKTNAQVIADAPLVDCTGDLHVAGKITCDSTIVAVGNITGDGISMNSHVHSGVESGPSNTGAPVR